MRRTTFLFTAIFATAVFAPVQGGRPTAASAQIIPAVAQNSRLGAHYQGFLYSAAIVENEALPVDLTVTQLNQNGKQFSGMISVGDSNAVSYKGIIVAGGKVTLVATFPTGNAGASKGLVPTAGTTSIKATLVGQLSIAGFSIVGPYSWKGNDGHGHKKDHGTFTLTNADV